MRQISAKEYTELVREKDDSKAQLVKFRSCFGYLTQYFVLETMVNLPG
jgi:hypothetical protein